ncbi:MBL fold metallo-hydrolase [Cnuibacter physcomitrellae]|uniref:MBL fold metallo-hydrolase n=1 Tax=Cnuibacter physcomitrellae TaxID=1619308 RepID=UPI0021758795|nr:MBL fold metallo-hydrolase [Cnuibacter physcomitrellae]MCS5498240.1 MBL fold metallo-hydrolase [Cnuibacter physcomitrellae]
MTVTRWTFGDVVVHRIEEFSAGFMPVLEMLPQATPELLDRNRDVFGDEVDREDDVAVLLYQMYLVQTPEHVVIVDTGVGNDKDRGRPEWHRRRDPAFLDGLARAGFAVEDVDLVVCTHIHPDHVGWNTVLRDGAWVPTFPGARYVFVEEEVDFARRRHETEGFAPYADSVLPIIEAGLADLVSGPHALSRHLRLRPATGHTVGHTTVVVGADRDDVVFAGDLLHLALQVRFPELSFVRDADLDRSAASRRELLEAYCDTETVLFTAHLPAPSAGRIRRSDSGYRLVALPDR